MLDGIAPRRAVARARRGAVGAQLARLLARVVQLDLRYPPEAATVLRWVPAVIVAATLIWCGVRPLSRLVVSAIGLFALWMLPAVFTALSSALGMRVLDGDLREMEMLPVVVALVIVMLGAVIRWRITASPVVERAERVKNVVTRLGR